MPSQFIHTYNNLENELFVNLFIYLAKSTSSVSYRAQPSLLCKKENAEVSLVVLVYVVLSRFP